MISMHGGKVYEASMQNIKLIKANYLNPTLAVLFEDQFALIVVIILSPTPVLSSLSC